MAVLYPVNGESRTVTPKKGTTFTLDELQGYVEGFIEMVRLTGGRTLWVNEEGKLRNLPVNVKATQIFCFTPGRSDRIVGPALVTEPGEVE